MKTLVGFHRLPLQAQVDENHEFIGGAVESIERLEEIKLCCDSIADPLQPEIPMIDVMLKRFENPDEVRLFENGRFEIVNIGGMTIGRATYEPGWKWSEHVGPVVGTPFCEVEHVGIVVSGTATAAMANGQVYELTPGTIFYVPPIPHDSWVVGDEPYVSIHLLGATNYTK
jgi:quercetin dioxygenase-like cupin family protein